MRAHLASCGRCAARWAAIEAQRLAFEADPPPLELESWRRASPGWRWPRLAVAAAVAAAAAVLLLVVPGRDDLVDEAAVRSKGDELFQLFIRHDARVRQAGDVEVVYSGDRLQFVYSSSEAGYVAVLSRDGAGMVSTYFPESATRASRAPSGRDQPLRLSTILDDTLGRELVVALFCSSSVELEPLRRELKAGRHPAPPGCSVQTFELDKRDPE